MSIERGCAKFDLNTHIPSVIVMAININDTERVNFLKSIMEIYPDGEFVSNMVNERVERVKREKGIDLDYDIIYQLVQSKLMYERDVFKTINIVKKKNKNGKAEDYVEITEEGIKQIWELAKYLYETDAFEYIRWILDWRERGDELAKHAYEELLSNEVSEWIDLMSSLVTPTSFTDSVKKVIVLRQIDADDEDQLNEFVSKAQKFLERAQMLGLVHSERASDGNGKTSVYYRLTNIGILVLNDLYDRARSSRSEFSSFSSARIKEKSLMDGSIFLTTAITFLLLLSLGLRIEAVLILIVQPILALFLKYVWSVMRGKGISFSLNKKKS